MTMRRTNFTEVNITFSNDSGRATAVIVPNASNSINIVQVSRDHLKKRTN